MIFLRSRQQQEGIATLVLALLCIQRVALLALRKLLKFAIEQDQVIDDAANARIALFVIGDA